MQALAFDLGGTHLRAAISGESGTLRRVKKQRIRSVANGLGEKEIWGPVIKAMLDYEHESRDLLHSSDPIVIAFPGPVTEHGRILQAPTVAGKSLNVRNIPAEVERFTGRRVYLLNDVSAAAWYFGAASDANRFLVVTVSSGIGSKIFDRRHPARVLDEPPYAGEIGHVVVDDRPCALLCDCGARGHLGAIASGRGIERAARLSALESPAEFACSVVHNALHGSAKELSNEDHIVPAALAGDPWALGIIRECTRPLARALLFTVMAAGLERIFIMGGFAQSMGQAYLEILRDLTTKISQYPVMGDALPSMLQIVNAGEEVCLTGCGIFLSHARVGVPS
jgi:glucokinase